MSLFHSHGDQPYRGELEDSHLLDDAIASAADRRNANTQNNDELPSLLAEEANSVVGGLIARPPYTTCGIIACEPPVWC